MITGPSWTRETKKRFRTSTNGNYSKTSQTESGSGNMCNSSSPVVVICRFRISLCALLTRINPASLKWLRDAFVVKRGSNIKVVDDLVRFNDDGEFCGYGPYIEMLLKNTNIERVGEVALFEWKLNASMIFETLNKGEMLMSGRWMCPVVAENKNLSVIFTAQLFANQNGFTDDDKKEEYREEMCGFTVQLHSDNNFGESLMVSVDIVCPEIKFSTRIFDVLMSMKNSVKAGVRRIGHSVMFPLSKIKLYTEKRNGDDLFWRVSIKASAFRND